MSNRTLKTIACSLVVAASPFVSAEEAQTVSPGVADRFAEVAGRCPTFSWAEVSEAESYELVVYRVPALEAEYGPTLIEFSDSKEVLFEKLPRGATGWTPERGRCLEPGASFAWFVRGIRRDDDEGPAADGEWSTARYFAISAQPSIAEVEEALGVLQRYSAGSVDAARSDRFQDHETAKPSQRLHANARPTRMPSAGQKHVTTTATASIKGEMLDPSGEAYGVIGISNSSNGAGIGAGNTNNGPDLVLDGSEDNDTDAIFTQAGIDRPSASADTMFFLLNSDEQHVLNLHVEGSVQFAAEGSDGGLFWRDPANGDLHMQVLSSKMMIDIGGGTRVTIDNTGAVTIDGSTVTVAADTLNLNGRSQLTLTAPNIDVTAVNDLQLGGTNIDISAIFDVDLEGMNITSTASMTNKMEGLTVNSQASGVNTLIGSLVKIN